MMNTGLVLATVCASLAAAQSTGMFTPTGSMTTPRYGHIATLLADGKVLIAGGNTVCSFGFAFPTGPSCLYPNRAEVYDPASGTFTATSRMSTANVAGAVLLPNDKVLIAGYDATQTTASVELYDPSTGQFTPAGNPATLTAVYSATLLNDGRVLLAGRVRNSSPVAYGAELYDPASGTFSPVANWPGQPPWSAVGLADATVLIASSHDYDSESERYDPSTDAFRATGSFAYYDMLPLPTLLANGNVLFTGGNTDFGNDNRAELYNPATGMFGGTASMSTYRNKHSVTLLPDSTVLVAGGAGQFQNTQPPLASTEIYNPARSGFSASGFMASARYAHTATLLNNGQVLITGGSATYFNLPVSGGSIGSLGGAELYTPAVVVPAPALLSISGDGKGQGAIWHAQTGQIASGASPAAAGQALSMYTTSLTEGSVIPPQVIVGGRVAQVLYFGDAPGCPGYYQVNFAAPAGVPPGPAVPVRLTYLGRSSNTVTIGMR